MKKKKTLVSLEITFSKRNGKRANITDIQEMDEDLDIIFGENELFKEMVVERLSKKWKILGTAGNVI